MAVKAGEAFVQLEVRGRRAAARTLDSVGRRLKSFGSLVRRLGTGLATMAVQASAAAAALGAAGLGAALAYSVKKASDLEETLNFSRAVFGEGSDEAEAWARRLASAFPVAEQAAIDQLAKFKSRMGGVGDEIGTEMAKGLLVRVNDLVSQQNLNFNEVSTALMAGMAGESEPLRRLGIDIQDAALKADALAAGFGKIVGPLDANLKRQLIYNRIIQGSSVAMGDTGKSAFSFANQVRYLKAQLEQMFTEAGANLLPTLSSLLTQFRAFVEVTHQAATVAFSSSSEFGFLSETLKGMPSPMIMLTQVMHGFLGMLNFGLGVVSAFGAGLAKTVELAATVASYVPGAVGEGAEELAKMAKLMKDDALGFSAERFEKGFDSFGEMFDVEGLKKQQEEILNGFKAQAADAVEIANMHGSTIIPRWEQAAKTMDKAADKIAQIEDAGIATANSGAASAVRQHHRKQLQGLADQLAEQKKANEHLQALVDKEPIEITEVKL